MQEREGDASIKIRFIAISELHVEIIKQNFQNIIFFHKL